MSQQPPPRTPPARAGSVLSSARGKRMVRMCIKTGLGRGVAVFLVKSSRGERAKVLPMCTRGHSQRHTQGRARARAVARLGIYVQRRQKRGSIYNYLRVRVCAFPAARRVQLTEEQWGPHRCVAASPSDQRPAIYVEVTAQKHPPAVVSRLCCL